MDYQDISDKIAETDPTNALILKLNDNKTQPEDTGELVSFQSLELEDDTEKLYWRMKRYCEINNFYLFDKVGLFDFINFLHPNFIPYEYA